MRNLNDIFCDQRLQCEMFPHSIIEYMKNGDKDIALIQLTQLLRSELDELPYPSREIEVYRFVGFPPTAKGASVFDNEILKDIAKGRMTLANPMNFNDPMDPIIKVWANEKKKNSVSRIEREMYKLIGEAMKSFRIGCFAKDNSRLRPYENTLMWGHYAKGHRGVCIKYVISENTIMRHTDAHHKLCFGDIRYREHKIMSDYISFDNALLAKSESWKYENESRLIYFTDDKNEWMGSDGKIKDYVSLDGFQIAAVYMGCNINKKMKDAIEMISADRFIQLYQMEFDMYDLTQMRARMIQQTLIQDTGLPLFYV